MKTGAPYQMETQVKEEVLKDVDKEYPSKTPVKSRASEKNE